MHQNQEEPHVSARTEGAYMNFLQGVSAHLMSSYHQTCIVYQRQLPGTPETWNLVPLVSTPGHLLIQRLGAGHHLISGYRSYGVTDIYTAGSLRASDPLNPMIHSRSSSLGCLGP